MNAASTGWASGISAITLFVDDLAVARQFYLDVFECPIVYEDADSVVFKLGETLINLLATTAARELLEPAPVGSPDAGPRLLFTIDVPDVDAMCALLTGRGVTLLNGPLDRPWGIRTASFSDPAGHVWEIAQPRR